jgi:ubiquitin-conjugating enzyme E2 J2
MKSTSSRLQREIQEVLKAFPNGVLGVACLDNNLHEVHFVLAGPQGTAFESGQYWGVFRFPSNYPSAPPSLVFFTPSGRFETGVKICASFTDFHPESWNVSWRLSTLLIAVSSFMVEDSPTAGSVNSFSFTRRELAAKSWEFNASQKQFKELFPQLCDAAKGKEMLKTYRASMQKQQLGLLVGLMLLMLCVILARLMGWF